MSGIKEGGSSMQPPLFDGTNHGYWKVRMTAFIKTIDEGAWTVVENG